MKAAELMVKCLEEEGVEFIFGIPGEENLDFLDALRNSSIRLIVTRHEQFAGFMAATYGRLTGMAGVCLSTLGPGATNLVTAAAYAQLGAMPMVILTGQKPIKSSKQGYFQIVDVVEMMHPLTKFSHQIINANSIPSLVRDAFRQAKTERPGSVHLELPEDIAQEQATAKIIEQEMHRRPIAEPKAVRSAVTMIEKSLHPLIVIGAGANRKRTGKMIKRFIDKTKIPFFNTQMGKGVVDERHPLFLGTAALSENDYLHEAIIQSDLIINVGHDIVEKPPFIMKDGGAEVIHINFSNAQVDPVYFPQLNVVGDIANSVYQITQEIEPKTHWGFEKFMQVKQLIDDSIKHKFDNHNDCKILITDLIIAVRQVMPDDGIIALDNGMYKIWFARNYLAYQHNTVLLDNALATMAAGLPSATVTKLLNPNKKVIAVCGDGGFMMSVQDLITVTNLKLDLVILVLNDNSFGMIKWKQSNMNLASFGLDLKNPDFIKLAESYGAKGHRIEIIEDFIATMEKCFSQGGVHLIEIPIEYNVPFKIEVI